MDFKQFIDDANREVDDVVRSAWHEFRHPTNAANGAVLDTVVLIGAFAAMLVVFTIPPARSFCHSLLLNALR